MKATGRPSWREARQNTSDAASNAERVVAKAEEPEPVPEAQLVALADELALQRALPDAAEHHVVACVQHVAGRREQHVVALLGRAGSPRS